MENRHYRGVVGPVLLIGAGLFLLLNSLGYLSWDIWGVLWRLWPVLLIAAGLEILIGRRSLLGSLLVALVLLAVMFGALVWGVQQQQGSFGFPAVSFERGPTRSVSISQPLEGADSAVYDIAFTAGQLIVDALPESSDLVSGSIELQSGEEASPRFELKDGVAYFTLHGENPAVIPALGQWGDNATTWELNLNRDIPTRLKVSTGAGESLLDLSRLTLTELSVEAGIGRTELFVPRKGRVEAEVSNSVGELIITIPPNVAARIELDKGLSSVEVSGKNYRQEGDTYTSRDFATASDRVDLRVDTGLGSVVVR